VIALLRFAAMRWDVRLPPPGLPAGDTDWDM
jgi:hypothetical protein